MTFRGMPMLVALILIASCAATSGQPPTDPATLTAEQKRQNRMAWAQCLGGQLDAAIDGKREPDSDRIAIRCARQFDPSVTTREEADQLVQAYTEG